MDTNKFNKDRQEWLSLSNQGLFVEARKFYFENLFEGIIDNFISKTVPESHCDVLFSVLGFSPEPIILTQRGLMPSVHVVFTTNKEKDSDNEIMAYLEKFLTSSYKIVYLKDESFESIHNALKEQMLIYPASHYVIDITGGKKSMVASASIFGCKYNCDVVYVDYDQYIPDLRRPMPGTEKLDVVYSVQKDLVSLLDVEKLKKANELLNINEAYQQTNISPQTIVSKTKVSFAKAYNMLMKAIDNQQITNSKIRLEYNDLKTKELVFVHQRYTCKVSYKDLKSYFEKNPSPSTADKAYFGKKVGTEERNDLMFKVISFLRKEMRK